MANQSMVAGIARSSALVRITPAVTKHHDQEKGNLPTSVTYFNKTTPPNPPQTVSLTRDQTYKPVEAIIIQITSLCHKQAAERANWE